jgi:hypothetical protein
MVAAAMPASRRRELLMLTAAALAVRAAFLVLEPPTGPIADETTWTNWAIKGLLRVHLNPYHLKMIFSPPLYPYFIAVVYAPFQSLTAVKWCQVVCSALLVPAVSCVGERCFSRPVGLVAGAIAAFYPELVWFSVHFWAETLFMALLWWGFERLLASRDGAWGPAVLAGLLWGLATLTRETVLYFLPIAALFLAWRAGAPGVLRAGAFVLIALVTIAPWTWRNWVVFETLIPVSTAGGLNLYQGNAFENGEPLSREEVYRRYDAIHGRAEQYRWARAQGIQAILDRQPWWIFQKLRDEMPNFWEADSQAVIHVKRGAYGWPVRPWIAVATAIVVLVPYLAVLVAFVAGIAIADTSGPRLFLLLFLLYYNAIHVVTHGYARYRLPAMPVLFLFAAVTWVALREGRLAFFPGYRHRLGAAAVTLALVFSLLPSLRLNLRDPAFRPREDAVTDPDTSP